MDQSKKKYNDLSKFLYNFKRDKTKCPDYSHNAFDGRKYDKGSYPGSYNIPSDNLDNFFELYCEKVFNKNQSCYLTESHTKYSPILIDLDFRIKELCDERKYNMENIQSFLKLYIDTLVEFVNIDNSKLQVFIMEKEKPVIVEDKKITKDGVHIIFPYVVSEPKLQHVLRHKLIKNKECKSLFEKLDYVNPLDDIIDASVIEKNGWLLYGSKKPGGEPYKLTHIYQYQDDKFSEINNTFSNTELVKVLSIRNKGQDKCVEIKEDMLSKLEISFEKLPAKHKIKKKRRLVKKNRNTAKNKCDNIEFVSKIIKILSKDRAESFESWIRTGWCLHNIDYDLLKDWIEFSKKSEKFEEGVCEEYWENMDNDGLNIGTLYLWAKTDNLDEYTKLVDEDIRNTIIKSCNETHTDVARVVYHLYKNEFVCSNLRKKKWFQYRNHKWVVLDDGITLKQRISNEVVKEYIKAEISIKKRLLELDELDDRKQLDMMRAKTLFKMQNNLKKVSFKKNVFDECCEIFYVEKFEEQLDKKDNLIGFNNGVYDLDLGEFREGFPEDYMSFSTNINYIKYNPESESDADELEEVWTFLKQVLPKKNVREYVVMLLSSFLSGKTGQEKFHIWTGCGGNGKSKLIELFEYCFGDYCCKLPSQIITRARGSGESATPALARTKGKRFACLQEPEANEEINVGLMKELTGGDKIMARALHQNPFEFKPKFKMVMTCNELPPVSANDRGTWRRIRVAEFISKFTENPSEDPNDYEYPIDDQLSEKLEQWPEAFMYILTEQHKLFRKFGIKEPKEVLIQTAEYENDSDVFKQFFSNKIIELDEYDGTGLSLDEAFTFFSTWFKQSCSNLKCPTRKDLKSNMIKQYGKCEGTKSRWKGISYKFEEGIDNETLNFL